MLNFKIIAVDFDGTLCKNKWPDIGESNEEVIQYLRNERRRGSKIILWTCRTNERLENAIAWCDERNLKFDAVNENIPEAIELYGEDTRKVFANEYIDDLNSFQFDLLCGDNSKEEPYIVHTHENAEFIGQIIDIFEDFLEEKKISIQNDEKDEDPDAAIIYGTDYGSLQTSLEEMMIAWKIMYKERSIKDAEDLNYGNKEGDLKTIENFVTKDTSVMEFKEIQAIVKMQYEIYKKMMHPTYIINTYNNGGK